MPRTLCIVGAGPAGLAAAHALRATDVRVVVVEKSRGRGGRAATRWRDVPSARGGTERWRYDHGAQVLTLDARAAALARDTLDATGLVQIDGPVWPFDSDGTLHPDRARDEARWTYADGLSALGHRLVDATPGLDLRLSTRVNAVVRDGAAWRVETDAGPVVADAVLVTAPAPQASTLVQDAAPSLAAALAAVPYRSQFSVVWAFDQPVPRRDAYALVHTGDGAHPVAWLAVESDKPGRAPSGGTILIAQMSDAWTAAHYEADRDAVVAAAVPHVEGLVGGALPAPLFTDTQRWRYSLPDAALDAHARAAAEADGLFVAGDGIIGRGRIHLALHDGADAAERAAGWLGAAT